MGWGRFFYVSVLFVILFFLSKLYTYNFQPHEFSRCNLKLSPQHTHTQTHTHTDIHTQGREKPEKEANHSRWVGNRFNKQRNLPSRLVLGSCMMSRSPLQSTRTFSLWTVLGFVAVWAFL